MQYRFAVNFWTLSIIVYCFATDYPGPRDGDLALEYEEIGMSLMIIFRKTKCFAADNYLIHFYRDYDVVEIYFDIGKIRL